MINQPNTTINSVRELETKIDTYRGQITLQESQITQNNKVLVDQEYTINQNVLRNKELEEFIEVKTKSSKELADSIVVLDNTISDKETLKKNLLEEISVIEDQIKTLLAKQDKLNAEIEEAKTNKEDREKRLDKKEKDLLKKEETVLEKLEIIKQFKSSL